MINVPRGTFTNLRFRKALLQRAAADPDFAREQWIMASRSWRYWIDAYVWTFSPKDYPDQPIRPFVLWDYQLPLLEKLDDSIGSRDLVIEKSRDMGASWLILMMLLWRWLFRPLQSFLLFSRIESLVDKRNEPDCLFWKLDFALDRLPAWMRPRNVERVKLALTNHDMQSGFTGASTTSDAGAGGRKTAVMLDEFARVDDGFGMAAATRDVTNCRIVNSSVMGTQTAFYEFVQKAREGKLGHLRIHWSEHPEKRRGLYQHVGGALQLFDERYRHPENYPFILDGKLRSPWYDEQCNRATHWVEIATNLDIDHYGSMVQFFQEDQIAAARKAVSEPFMVGELDFDPETVQPEGVSAVKDGRLSLWCDPEDIDLTHSYVAGCDIAMGTGATNSVMAVYDAVTRNQVAEFVTPHLRPEQFARTAVALARFFKTDHADGAYLIWEMNGPGRPFGAVVLECGYRYVYYYWDDRDPRKKRADRPGWAASREGRMSLLSGFREGITAGRVIPRAYPLIRELAQYVYMPNGSIAHSSSETGLDPSGARENHADRVIAHALACLVMSEVPHEEQVEPPEPPFGSLAWRREQQRNQELAGQYRY